MDVVLDRSKAFWARCRKCEHRWAAAYYPQDLSAFVKIVARAHCSKCGAHGKDVTLAKQHGGELLPENEA